VGLYRATRPVRSPPGPQSHGPGAGPGPRGPGSPGAGRRTRSARPGPRGPAGRRNPYPGRAARSRRSRTPPARRLPEAPRMPAGHPGYRMPRARPPGRRRNPSRGSPGRTGLREHTAEQGVFSRPDRASRPHAPSPVQEAFDQIRTFCLLCGRSADTVARTRHHPRRAVAPPHRRRTPPAAFPPLVPASSALSSPVPSPCRRCSRALRDRSPARIPPLAHPPGRHAPPVAARTILWLRSRPSPARHPPARRPPLLTTPADSPSAPGKSPSPPCGGNRRADRVPGTGPPPGPHPAAARQTAPPLPPSPTPPLAPHP
jgi:hypothetical protein